MSYSDYNYQQNSTVESSAGFVDSTFTQGTYDASQYGSYDQYSMDKQPQYTNQYDYTYTENYQQPADTTTPVDYYSLNAASYSHENSIAPLPSTGYDAPSGYSQISAYQYSNSAEQNAAIPTTSQNYTFQNSAFDTSSATYEYSEPTSYTNPAAGQYEQSGYSYNPNSTGYSDTTNQDYNALLSNSSFSSQYSKSNQPSHVSASGSNVDYQDSNFGIQNTQIQNTQIQNTQLGGYQSTQSISGAGGYQSTQSISGTGGYQSTPSSSGAGGYQSTQSSSGAGGYQSTQSSSGAGGYQSTQSISGTGGYQSTQSSSGAGGYQSTQSSSNSGGGSSYQNAQSGPGGYDKTQSRISGFQNTQSGAYHNTQSVAYLNTQSDGFQNSASGYYSGSFDTTRQDLNTKRDEPLSGYSFATKKEYGSYSQSSSSGFSPRAGSSNFSQSGGKNFSQSGGNNFSNSGGNNFSHSGGNSFSSSRGNSFSNSGGNNFSFSGGSNYSQQGPRGRNNFNQRRDDRGLPITARNMGNNQGRMNNNQMGTNMNNDNTRSSDSGSWRGSPRGGGGNYSQNRGGFNDIKNDTPNRSSPRGGKFDNNAGPRDNRGNQFQSRNQNSGDQDRSRRPLFNRGTWSDAGNNKRETSSTKTIPQSDSAYHTNIVNKSPKVTSKDEGKAPFYPNQKLLNEVEAKKKENAKKEEVKVSDAKPTEDVKKNSEVKATDGQKEKTLTDEAKSKSAEQKVMAPPTKTPETPEEIAREEEIQRKIRESIVVVNPDNEKSLLSDDPMKEVDMSTELRDLLKTLTTEHFCKLCTLRMVGPQMATMHYNGKNHLKKVRIFIQTNGRSAGYNMDTMNTDDSSDMPKVDNESSEVTEETELDEKKYCKICKVSFSQESQSEMHYKGKNHAKKLRSVANGSELFECKVCCVTVTAQEHLTAHLNGARHKLQIRKMEGDNAHRGGLRGRGVYRGKGGRGGMSGSTEGDEGQSQGQTGFRGRGRGGRGQNWRGGFDRDGKLIINDEKDEELYNLLGLTPEKRYKFDLANFRTPSGKFYCSSCDIVMEEEPQFLLHLGNRKHQEKVYKLKPKGARTCLKIKVEREPCMFSRNQ